MFLLYYAGPFIGVAILLFGWFYLAYKLEHRAPWFYTFSLKVYDKLPKLAGVVVIIIFLYFYFTQPSYYDW